MADSEDLFSAEIDVLVATLSHALRTPLNGIVGWTDLLKNGARSGEDIERAAESIDRNAKTLSRVVSGLLEVLPHVFERCRQEESGQALGLGMAIVKHLVEENAGPMSVDVVQPNLDGIHVLIVEDDPDGNELACMVLQRYGARVTSVMSATRALDVLDMLDAKGEQPQVLVSDIGLPDMDGIELIKRVRRGTGANIPAVALTAYASRQDATKAILAGFDAHVAKPVQPATLGSIVSHFVGRERAASPRSASSAA